MSASTPIYANAQNLQNLTVRELKDLKASQGGSFPASYRKSQMIADLAGSSPVTVVTEQVCSTRPVEVVETVCQRKPVATCHTLQPLPAHPLKPAPAYPMDPCPAPCPRPVSPCPTACPRPVSPCPTACARPVSPCPAPCPPKSRVFTPGCVKSTGCASADARHKLEAVVDANHPLVAQLSEATHQPWMQFGNGFVSADYNLSSKEDALRMVLGALDAVELAHLNGLHVGVVNGRGCNYQLTVAPNKHLPM